MGSLNIFDGSAWKPTGVTINNYNIPPASVGTDELKDGSVTQDKLAEGIELGVTMTKLWENASPGSQFAAQTISVDFTGYDYYYVYAINYMAGKDAAASPFLVPVGGGGFIYLVDVNHQASQGYNLMTRERVFSSTPTSVTFEDCFYQHDGVHGGKTNTHIIPLAIYGIKGAD